MKQNDRCHESVTKFCPLVKPPWYYLNISECGEGEKIEDEKPENYPEVQLIFSWYTYSKHHTKLKQTKNGKGEVPTSQSKLFM